MLKYSKQDVEILLFKKILKNEIEENFANIIEQVKFSIQELLKGIIVNGSTKKLTPESITEAYN